MSVDHVDDLEIDSLTILSHRPDTPQSVLYLATDCGGDVGVEPNGFATLREHAGLVSGAQALQHVPVDVKVCATVWDAVIEKRGCYHRLILDACDSLHHVEPLLAFSNPLPFHTRPPGRTSPSSSRNS